MSGKSFRLDPTGLVFHTDFPLDQSRIRLGFTTRRHPFRLAHAAEFPHWLKAAVSENAQLESPIPFQARQAYGLQIHSNRIQSIAGKHPSAKALGFKATDGLATHLKGVQLNVFSADCLPIFIGVPGKRPWISLLHAGWRGTLLRISTAAIRLLRKWTGISPQGYRVYLGPCLRVCCFKAGPGFHSCFPHATRRPAKKGPLHFDLVGENIRQLTQEGVRPVRIFDSNFCTVCRNDLFYSYRKEKEKAARTISWIYRENNPS